MLKFMGVCLNFIQVHSEPSRDQKHVSPIYAEIKNRISTTKKVKQLKLCYVRIELISTTSSKCHFNSLCDQFNEYEVNSVFSSQCKKSYDDHLIDDIRVFFGSVDLYELRSFRCSCVNERHQKSFPISI